MASEVLERRLRLVYGLVAVLYLALGLDFYLTAKLWFSFLDQREFLLSRIPDSGPAYQYSRERKEEHLLHRRSKRQYPVEENRDASVEFFPQPQPTHETDGYLWLTSYSRIPVQVLEEFCFSANKHCLPRSPGPPGKPGPPGFRGDKGDRGDRGLPGEPGPRGPQGFHGIPGPVGPKGEHGKPGIPGLDGRDGIPGEPGLDGVPGRDGIDGIPGRDGIPGIPGTPGRPGTNGTNGIPGSPGPRGPAGPPGPTGLPGPRGRKGVPGKSGTPGIPGIKAWSTISNDSQSLLIPPSIIDVESQQPLMVDEGHNVRLHCDATGQPPPKIKWRSDEGKPIHLKSWQVSSVQDGSLEIQRVSREHMGVYACMASNGVPPNAIMKFKLDVAFPPLIKIRNQMVGTMNGSFALLECFVEANPPAVNFWLHGDNRMVEPSWKYKISSKDDLYRTHMTLNITYVEPMDYGLYKCVSKNDKGKTLGVFTVFEIDPNAPTRKPPVEPTYEIYGKPPPPSTFDETSCEPCNTKCDPSPFCPTPGSPDAAWVMSLPVLDYDPSDRPKHRTDNCMIHMLGKPVFQRYTKEETGAWFQDAMPNSANEHKYYVTLPTVSSKKNHVYEYADREAFRKDNWTKRHDLPFDFEGNAHLVYNGSFYYHQARSRNLVRYVLANKTEIHKTIEDAVFPSPGENLYSTGLSYMDVTADENGVWLIYAAQNTNNTLVMKLNPFTLDPEFVWNITLLHKGVGDMFIACGVLYAVNSVTTAMSQIRIAFDLYQNKALEVDIPFANPFSQNTMVTYNPRHRKIFTWDKGNQLVYPILFGTIDSGQPDVDQQKDDLLSNE